MLWLFGIAVVAGLAWYAWRKKGAQAGPSVSPQKSGGQVDE